MKKSRSYYKSSSFKMAALFTIMLGMCAVILGYFLYDISKQNFIRETEAAIDSEIQNILAISKKYNKEIVIDYINSRSNTEEHPVYFFQDKNEIFLAGTISLIPRDIDVIKEGVILFDANLEKKSQTIAAKITTFSDGASLLVGRDIHKIVQGHERMRLFTIVIMLFMLAVVVISFLISNFVVSRINKIANTAKMMMDTGDLSRRIEVDSKWDDLSYLAKTLNELLDKIQLLMTGIRDVSDNIAHDLRTPITRLKNNLEGLKSDKPSKKAIEKLIDETDHILNIFNSLLRISNIEKGKRYVSFEDVDLTCILKDVTELYEPFAEDKNVKFALKLQENLKLNGDRDLLFQMIANLIDNAIKFSDSGQTVEIISKIENDKIIVEISDGGIGVLDEEFEKIFDRFYRTDKSRNTKGNGLGLTMVKAVADLHRASIRLENNQPGLKIKLFLPFS